jgi:putative nucleotidyltransferase with HDIG domain
VSVPPEGHDGRRPFTGLTRPSSSPAAGASTGPVVPAAPASLDDVMTRVDNLPTLSSVAIRMGELVNNPRTGVREIADVMRQDPALSAKVLRLVNSSYYAIPGGVTDVSRAISFVGFNNLYQLVLSASVMTSMKTPTGADFDARGLWLHSLAVGSCAEVIAKKVNHADPSSCFTAGLLHDLGKIALAIAEPNRFGSALDAARKAGLGMNVCEKEAGLPSHDRVGSHLARRWKFPAMLLAPIECHHHAPETGSRSAYSSTLQSGVDVVALADDLCRSFKLGESGSPHSGKPAAPLLDRLGLSPLHVDELHTSLMRRLETSKVFLDLVD